MSFFKKLLPKAWRLSLEVSHVKRKMKEADKKKIITGKQQFVIALNNGRLKVVDSSYRKIFNHLKRKGKNNLPELSYMKIMEIAIYHTK